MSTPTRNHHSGDVNTPSGSVPLTLPRRSPRGHASPAKETATVLFQQDDDGAAKENDDEKTGDAKKKKRSATASSGRSKQKEVAPTKKKRKKKSAVESPTKNKEKRQANFSPDEDYMLCCAYINVSVDPIIGVGQKSETFWTRVLEKYLLLTEQYLADNGDELPVRNSASLQQRWKKRIANSMQLWNKFYRQVKSVKRSGWNEDNYLEEASKLYKEEVGKTFGLENCVPVLHKLPKFDPMLSGSTEESSSPRFASADFLVDDTTSDDDYEGAEESDEDEVMSKRTQKSSIGSNKKAKVNNSAPAQGSKASRPIGMKKAKKLAKLESERSRQSVTLARAQTMEVEGMASMTKELVAVFKANAAMKQQVIDASQHKKWMKMAQMYFKNGEKEKGLALLARIEAADGHNPDIPGNIAIDETVPNEDQLSVENDSDEEDDVNVI
jgi:hypothetical protein